MISQIQTKKVYVIFIYNYKNDKVKESEGSVACSRNKKGKNED